MTRPFINRYLDMLGDVLVPTSPHVIDGDPETLEEVAMDLGNLPVSQLDACNSDY